jgi:hypothetical protein
MYRNNINMPAHFTIICSEWFNFCKVSFWNVTGNFFSSCRRHGRILNETLDGCVKIKLVPVHAMKAYSGVELWSGAVAPLIILDTG